MLTKEQCILIKNDLTAYQNLLKKNFNNILDDWDDIVATIACIQKLKGALDAHIDSIK